MDETERAVLVLVAIIGSSLAVLSAIGNIIAFVWSARETSQQRKETRELAKVASDLEHRVHRLNLGLDQRIAHLHRARELLGRFVEVHTQSLDVTLTQADRIRLTSLHFACLSEFIGLVDVISDSELAALVKAMEDDVRESFGILDSGHDRDAATAAVFRIIDKAQAIFSRIYQLIEIVTIDTNKRSGLSARLH